MKQLKVVSFLVLVLAVTVVNAQDNCKCCTENHKAFDFWEGEWVVYKPDGTLAGTNSIVKIQNQCILRENWISAGKIYTGTSYNFYNSSTNQWEQIWVDNQGGSLHLKGNLVEGKMVLESDDLKNAEGVFYKNRITWSKNDDGYVRQLWEVVSFKSSGEETKNVLFDGLYKKE